MARKSGSSSHWRQQQGRDPYVEKAVQQNVRSRAYFKLEQIQAKERILKPGIACADLGASPGGWSQYAAGIVGSRGGVWAVDLAPMEPIPGVRFIQGDFTNHQTLAALEEALLDAQLDLVMSDMSPNITGHRAVDQPRIMDLATAALSFSETTLRRGGVFLVKLFQGEGMEDFVKLAEGRFQKVRLLKPQASRPDSRETYLLARNYGM
ncbi:MAG: RlmE family RNA methyltransferase [Gammaproteobacteria bacterium]